VVIIICH